MSAEWVAQQFTLGNLAVVASMVANIGYQMRRLYGIEQELHDIKDKQRTGAEQRERDRQELAGTLAERAKQFDAIYMRRDLHDAQLGGIHAQLAGIAHSQAEIRAELRELNTRNGRRDL